MKKRIFLSVLIAVILLIGITIFIIYPKKTYAIVTKEGSIHVNKKQFDEIMSSDNQEQAIKEIMEKYDLVFSSVNK